LTRLAAALLLVALAGCDRFADEERRLIVAVVDAQDRPASGARVFVVPRAGGARLGTTFAFAAPAPPRAERVFYRVIRESSGASTDVLSARVEAGGAARIEIAAADVGAGLFRLRYGQDSDDAREVFFVLAAPLSALGTAPTPLLTGSDGTADVNLDEVGAARTLDLTLTLQADGTQPVVRATLGDTLDVIAYRDGRQAARTVAPSGNLTRTTLTLIDP
jgi:hypothetical protein